MVRAARIEVECVQRIAPSKAPKHCLNARNFSNGIRLVSRAEVPVACCAGQSDVAAKICSFARTPCLDKTPNIFVPPLRSALLTTYTRSLTATFHREKREDSYFRAAPSALDREAAACVAIRPKDFDASSQLRVLINGGIIQDESFLT